MTLKGLFKNSSFIVQLLMLISISILGAIIFSLLFYFFLMMKGGFSMEMLENPAILYQNPGTLRIMLFFQSLGSFFFPALFLAYLFSDDKKVYLQIQESSSIKAAFYIVLSMLALQPFINLTAGINEMIKLPETMKMVEDWILQMEKEAQEVTEMLLHTKSLSAFIFNIIIIGILAAVGEEFFFRGVLQNVFRKLFQNEHVIIWVVAIVFSAVHFQFYGFLPRVLLGAYFGYLLYYTKNIWAPVLAHFTNNAIGVIGYYALQDTNELKALDSMGTGSDWWLGLLSLLLWSFLFVKIVKITKRS